MQLEFADADAEGVLGLEHGVGIGVIGRRRVERDGRVEEFVVDHHGAPESRVLEERHAVVALPELESLIGGGVGAVERERRPTRGEWITPRDDHLRVVPVRDDDRVGHAGGDRGEPERRVTSAAACGPTAVLDVGCRSGRLGRDRAEDLADRDRGTGRGTTSDQSSATDGCRGEIALVDV